MVLPDGTKVEVTPPPKDRTVRQFVDSILEEHLKTSASTKNEQKSVNTSKLNNSRIPLNFNLEAKEKPGVALDPAAPFFSFRGGSEVFYIVRENSRRYSSKSDLGNYLS